MPNSIYRGPAESEALTINVPIVGALLPGLFVTKDGALAVTDTGRLFILGNRRFFEQDLATAYVSGETGILYRLAPEQNYQARVATAAYTDGQELTVNASGQLKAAAIADVVVAYYDQAAATPAANELVDIVIANSYKKA